MADRVYFLPYAGGTSSEAVSYGVDVLPATTPDVTDDPPVAVCLLGAKMYICGVYAVS